MSELKARPPKEMRGKRGGSEAADSRDAVGSKSALFAGAAQVVIAEVLQGLTRGAEEIERYLAMWDMLEARGFKTYREAAALFRLGRANGISLTTIDTLIAAIALEHGASVFTLDKEFHRIARLTKLPLHSAAGPAS